MGNKLLNFKIAKMEIVDWLRPSWLEKEEEVYFPISKMYNKTQKGEVLATFFVDDKSYPAIIRNSTDLHFNFDYEDAIKNILFEYYCYNKKSIISYLPFHYRKIPFSIRNIFINYFIRKKFHKKKLFPVFPAEKSLEVIKYIIKTLLSETLYTFNWPNCKKYCIILTHDVDTKKGFKQIGEIQKVEEEYGFKSSWNVVGKLYPIEHSILEYLVNKGCEIGLHGYNHDNKIAYQKESEIREKIIDCMDLIKRYNIKGFRSPSYLRSPTLFNVLQDYFLYDSSVPDVDFFSPSNLCGCCSIFPYKVGNLVELPVTIPYEIPLFIGYRIAQLNDFWKPKIDWIKEAGGMILINTHSDPHLSGNLKMIRSYKNLLAYVKKDDEGFTAKPSEIGNLFKRDLS